MPRSAFIRTMPTLPTRSGLDELRELLAHERAVAVGETGLDHYRDYAPHPAQARLFEEHLGLADELGLPVVVHSRAAARETVDALSGFAGDVILHCFSELELLDVALERRYYVSFAGNVTYPKATELREAARQVPATASSPRPTARSWPRRGGEAGRTSRRSSSTRWKRSRRPGASPSRGSQPRSTRTQAASSRSHERRRLTQAGPRPALPRRSQHPARDRPAGEARRGRTSSSRSAPASVC